jgi:cyclic pyranopterin phosphate synthase
LSADGSLFTCLFASEGHDLRALLRQEISDADLSEKIRAIWTARTDRYSETRAEQTVDASKIEMSYIGG